MLRKRLLVLGRERQLTARALAGRIAETVDGAAEIHANGTSNYERAEISARLGRIFRIRFEFYQRKFLIKFLNNFLSQVTPFLFYTVGGSLVIVGRLDFTLVLFWTSLGVSAAIVALFLWLMREERQETDSKSGEKAVEPRTGAADPVKSPGADRSSA